jgi:hypothetical protein
MLGGGWCGFVVYYVYYGVYIPYYGMGCISVVVAGQQRDIDMEGGGYGRSEEEFW